MSISAVDIETELALYRAPMLAPDSNFKVLKWLMRRLDAAVPGGVLAAEIGVARIEVDNSSGDFLWRPTPALDLEGSPDGVALVLPVRDHEGMAVDLLALHPTNAAHAWLRYGHGRALGERALMLASMPGDMGQGPLPLRIFETPMDLLRGWVATYDAHAARVRSARDNLETLVMTETERRYAAGEIPDPDDMAAEAMISRRAVLARLYGAAPPRFEEWACCVLGPGQAGIEDLLVPCTGGLLVENAAYGVALGKQLDAARRRRRNAEPKLPPIFHGHLPIGDGDGKADEAEDEAAA